MNTKKIYFLVILAGSVSAASLTHAEASYSDAAISNNTQKPFYRISCNRCRWLWAHKREDKNDTLNTPTGLTTHTWGTTAARQMAFRFLPLVTMFGNAKNTF
ncbi:MAG: hypothetical protein H6925_05290 [Holosporaceae bacterium]|nr:MAG: hypothetical protein H6925_05290 [Holosporaceae bacterium]